MIVLLLILITGLSGIVYSITHDFTEDFERCPNCRNVMGQRGCIVCKNK